MGVINRSVRNPPSGEIISLTKAAVNLEVKAPVKSKCSTLRTNPGNPTPAEPPAYGEAPDIGMRLRCLEDGQTALRAQLVAMEALLRLRDPILQRYGATDQNLLCRHAAVEAIEHIEPDRGFGALVYSEAGIALRWIAGGSEASLLFYVNRAAALAITLGVDGPPDDILDRLTLLVDGEVQRLVRRGGGVLCGLAPARAATGPTEISLRLASPADGEAVSDGLAFTRLALNPA